MTHVVVITRPIKQANALAQRVQESGRQTVIFPLLEILPLEDATNFVSILRDVTRYALVIFVSPNAIEATFSYVSVWPEGVPVAVMGEGSRIALRQYGVSEANTRIIHAQDTDQTGSEQLLETIKTTVGLFESHRKRVLIIRGETGRELLAETLHSEGWQVTQIAGYRRKAVVWDDEKLVQLRDLLSEKNDWYITSSEALDVWVEGINRCLDKSIVSEMQRQNVWAPHLRITQKAEKMGFKNVTWARLGVDALQSQ